MANNKGLAKGHAKSSFLLPCLGQWSVVTWQEALLLLLPAMRRAGWRHLLVACSGALHCVSKAVKQAVRANEQQQQFSASFGRVE